MWELKLALSHEPPTFSSYSAACQSDLMKLGKGTFLLADKVKGVR